MRLKSFYAKTMTEAMQMVRDTLGDDAVIVATREEKGGKSVHVTAAIEPGLYDRDDRSVRRDDPNFEIGHTGIPAHSKDWLQYDEEDEGAAVTEEITDAMLRHGVPEDVMDHVISCATVIGMENPGAALVAAIEHLFTFAPFTVKRMDKALMLVGPPGAGKTLAVAKLAARAAMQGLTVGAITTDTVRAGGVEQLEAFTSLLRIDLYRVDNERGLAEALQALRHCDQVIIDTQGVNPFSRHDMRDIAKLAGVGSITPSLVLPAASDADESGEMARAFSTIGVGHLLPTRLDIARRLGGLLSAAHHGHMVFTDASNTPKVADGLLALSPQSLAKLLMPQGYREQSPLDSRARSVDPMMKKRAYQ